MTKIAVAQLAPYALSTCLMTRTNNVCKDKFRFAPASAPLIIVSLQHKQQQRKTTQHTSPCNSSHSTKLQDLLKINNIDKGHLEVHTTLPNV